MNGNRKELAIVLTGSRNPLSWKGPGDWLRDAESQLWFASQLKDNNISNAKVYGWF